MKILIAVALAVMLFAVPAFADVPPTYKSMGTLEGGGFAMLYPFNGGSTTEAVVNFKALPIQEPSLGDIDNSNPWNAFWTNLAYGVRWLGANAQGNLLFPWDGSGLNLGASVPVYSVGSGLMTGQLGLAYLSGDGWAVSLQGLIGMPQVAAATALTGLAPERSEYATWAVTPSGAMLAYHWER